MDSLKEEKPNKWRDQHTLEEAGTDEAWPNA
jgi:hypothetical protein